MTTPRALAPAVRNLLKDLAFRSAEAAQGRPCWIVDAPRDRFALIVPVDHTPLEYLRTVTRRPIRDAEARGLVTLSEQSTDVPPFTHRPDMFAGQRRSGYTIALTDAGKAAAGPPTNGATP